MSTSVQRIIDFYRYESSQRQLILTPDRTTTIRFQGARPLTLLELPGGLAFHPGNSVLLPQSPEGDALSSLHVAARALVHVAQFPGQLLLAAGHVASEANGLAQRRADALTSYLLGERDRWAKEAHVTAEVRDWQRILTWVAKTRGWACDPGGVDNLTGPRSREGLSAFREAYATSTGRSLSPADAPTCEDWGAFFDCYDAELAGLFGEGPEQLAARRSALNVVGEGSVGCGAAWPLENIRIGNYAGSTRERIDLLFFAPADVPRLKCHPEGEPCNWKKCDVYRKAKYELRELAPQADAQAADAPLDQRVRLLLSGVLFETEKCFMLPSSLRGIRALRSIYESQRPQAILVVGHTDTTGSEAYNRTLSVERAEAVVAYLRDDVDAWLDWYEPRKKAEKRWGTREDKLMLRRLVDEQGVPFYAGPIDSNHRTAETKDAVRRFQEFANRTLGESLEVDGYMGELSRRPLIHRYMAEDGTSLPPEVEVLVHGCGEFHPFLPTDDDVPEAENRRVEMFLFPPPSGVVPAPLADCPEPEGCNEYGEWLNRTTHTIDLGAEPGDLGVLVLDAEAGTPIPSATVTLAGLEQREGSTDGLGAAVFTDLLPTRYRLEVSKAGFLPGSGEAVVQAGLKGAAPQALASASQGFVSAAEATPATEATPADLPGAAVVRLAAIPEVTSFLAAPVQPFWRSKPFKTWPNPYRERWPHPGAPPTPPAKPTLSELCVIHQGWRESIELEWKVKGQPDRVELRGLRTQDVTQANGSLSIRLKEFPPRKDGTFELVAIRGETTSAAKTIQLVGIKSFNLVSRQGSGHFLEVLRNARAKSMHTPRNREPAKRGVLRGRPGSFGPRFQASKLVVPLPLFQFLNHFSESSSHAGPPFGWITGTLEPQVELSWRVFGADRVRVSVVLRGMDHGTVHKSWPDLPSDTKPGQTGTYSLDVTERVRQSGGKARTKIKAKCIESSTFWDADLRVYEDVGGKNGRLLTSSVISLQLHRELPKIESFAFKDANLSLANGGTLASWKDLNFDWKLTGDAFQTRLDVVIEADDGFKHTQGGLKPRAEKAPASSSNTFVGQIHSSQEDDLRGKTLRAKALLMDLKGKVVDEFPRGKSSYFSFQLAKGSQAEEIFCRTPDCPLRKAISLRHELKKAVEDWKQEQEKTSVRLSAAHFVKSVARRLHRKESQREDTWDKLRRNLGTDGVEYPIPTFGKFPKTKKGIAEEFNAYFARTYLHEDIKRIEAEVAKKKANAERLAKLLTGLLQNHPPGHERDAALALKKHVDEFHEPRFLSREDALRYYDVDAPQAIRESDHYLAELTEGLSATDAGMKFIKRLAKLDVKETPLFEKALARLKIANSAYSAVVQPLQKLLFNASTPAIADEVLGLLNDMAKGKGILKTGTVLLGHERLKYAVKPLDDLTDGQFSQRLKELVPVRSQHIDYEIVKDPKRLNRILKRLDKEIQLKHGAELEKVRLQRQSKVKTAGTWFGLILDVLSLYLAVTKITGKVKAKDMIAITGSIASTTRSVIDLFRARQVGVGSRALAVAVTGLTVVSAICSVVVSGMEFLSAAKHGYYDEMGAHALAGLSAVMGAYGYLGAVWGLAGASACTGIGALIAIAVAIYMTFFVDAPIYKWLGATEWGSTEEKHKKIKVRDTKDQFFIRNYTLEIVHVVLHEEEGITRLEILCPAISKTMPVRIVVVDESNGRKVGTRKRGRGDLFAPNDDDVEVPPLHSDRIYIPSPWDVWKVQRSPGAKYTFKAHLNTDDDAFSELKDKTTGVSFPPKQRGK